MLTIAIVLLVLWGLGLVGGYALGGLIHLLLVIAVIIFAVRLFTGRRVA
ncbi:MAG TPA: lmo0937 family membrane protein [Gemmatimonadaceae bacterium]